MFCLKIHIKNRECSLQLVYNWTSYLPNILRKQRKTFFYFQLKNVHIGIRTHEDTFKFLFWKGIFFKAATTTITTTTTIITTPPPTPKIPKLQINLIGQNFYNGWDGCGRTRMINLQSPKPRYPISFWLPLCMKKYILEIKGTPFLFLNVLNKVFNHFLYLRFIWYLVTNTCIRYFSYHTIEQGFWCTLKIATQVESIV